jgi:hypothetical protein
MDNIIEPLAKDIAEASDGNPEEARQIVGELAKIDWQAYLAGAGFQAYISTSLVSRVKQLELEIAELKKQLPGDNPRTYKKKVHSIPHSMPKGTVYAKDFYEKHDVSYSAFRYHTEKGYNGDKLETTNIPHPTKPGVVSARYLTPAQQEKAIAYWDKHNVSFIP